MATLKDFLQGKWLGHPLHPALVHVPTALWPAAMGFDLLSVAGIGGNDMVRTSFYAILVGLLAVLAVVPTGVADWSEIKREKPAWKIGLYHMILNLIVAILWAINLGLRVDTLGVDTRVSTAQLMLSIIATLLLLVSGYLGGLMVYDYGISVARISKKKWRRIAEAGHANLPPQGEE